MDAGDTQLMEREARASEAISRLPRAVLVERRDITPELIVIKLEPQVTFTFKAGQYCTLGIGSVERAYSIVSAPHEPYLEIFVELVPRPDGVLTPLMWKLKVGDSMSIRPRAKGIFTLDEHYVNHLMVATVTGIAPFMSTIRSYIHSRGKGHRFHLLQGASYQDEYAYDREIMEAARTYSDTITYVPTVSRPGHQRNAGWKGATVRVNAIVEEHVDRYRLDPASSLVYACGHPGMIEDVKERLASRAFKVKEERYWKQ